MGSYRYSYGRLLGFQVSQQIKIEGIRQPFMALNVPIYCLDQI